jgi:hypothetical protein
MDSRLEEDKRWQSIMSDSCRRPTNRATILCARLSLSRINRVRERDRRETEERDGEKAFPVFGRVPGPSTTGDMWWGVLEEEEEEKREAREAHGALQHAETHGGHLLATGFGGFEQLLLQPICTTLVSDRQVTLAHCLLRACHKLVQSRRG